MSGFTTEQSEYKTATSTTAMIHGKKFNNNSFNAIEFMAEDLDDELQVSHGQSTNCSFISN